MLEYKLPKLYDANGNIKKSWYVYYSILQNGSFKRIRVKGEINSFKSRVKRYQIAAKMIDELNLKLHYGIESKVKVETEVYSCRRAFDLIIEVKRNVIRPTSMKDYKTTSKMFLNWLKNDKVLLEEIFQSNHQETFFQIVVPSNLFYFEQYHNS